MLHSRQPGPVVVVVVLLLVILMPALSLVVVLVVLVQYPRFSGMAPPSPPLAAVQARVPEPHHGESYTM